MWARLGSNQRPSGYEPPALTAELRAPFHNSIQHFFIFKLFLGELV